MATIAPKYLYDALGSRLFSAITELPEYYPTRTEAAIFSREMKGMADALGPVATLVDLGAGNCEKAARLFETFRVQRYVAVDISVNYLRDSLACLQREHPEMDMLGVGLDFSAALALPAEIGEGPRTLFYPGSSIGNFSPAEACAFLGRLAGQMDASGGLLIGVDLIKEKSLLDAAYDDALGVTAAFNRNLLRHVNARLDADFDIGDWQHVAFFNEAAARIEMHLEARRDLDAGWPDEAGRRIRRFAAGERIHTENSYKYSPDGFSTLLTKAGFADIRMWTDPRGWFALFFARQGSTRT